MTAPAIAGRISQADPADVMLIMSIALNKFRGRMQVDHVFCLNGETYADVSQRNPSPTDPPDSTTYVLWRGERNVKGEDVEVIQLREVEWHNGALQFNEEGADREAF